MPTNTICTRPRTIDIAVSRSTCTANRRHRSTTPAQSTMAPAAWANPMTMSLFRLFMSSAITEHLLGGADGDQLAGFQDHRAVGDTMSLDRIMSDDHAGHSPLANDAQHKILDPSRRNVIERRGRFVEQECLRSVRQRAGERHTLG